MQYLSSRAIALLAGFMLVLGSMAVSASPISWKVVGGSSDDDLADALAAYNDFLGSASSIENFGDFDAGTQEMEFSTEIGKITFGGGATGSSCRGQGFGFECGDGGGIVNINDLQDGTPGPGFWGRQPMPQGEDNPQYLDSLDMSKFWITPNAGTSKLGFFVTDPNDAGGNLSLVVGEEEFALFGTRLTNNHVYWVEISDLTGAGLGQLYFKVNNTSDGIGIDTMVAVPEPSALVLIGLGLLAMALVSRRRTRLTA